MSGCSALLLRKDVRWGEESIPKDATWNPSHKDWAGVKEWRGRDRYTDTSQKELSDLPLSKGS